MQMTALISPSNFHAHEHNAVCTHTQEMNDYYFNLPIPDENQRPEQIRQLLQKARRETSQQMSNPPAPH